MICVDGCELQSFDGKIYRCILYETELKAELNNIIRCHKCIKETIEWRKNDLNRMAQAKKNGK